MVTINKLTTLLKKELIAKSTETSYLSLPFLKSVFSLPWILWFSFNYLTVQVCIYIYTSK